MKIVFIILSLAAICQMGWSREAANKDECNDKEIFLGCGQCCEDTCAAKCANRCMRCVKGCYCRPGYTRIQELGACIPWDECPK
ncbi:chymotrypsin-elastase inhibitor ixodidin-like [Topomyia yanbarensis]|uniref:chymotrypsin-elastase inhibitor ixodidin-like n=1 Tax=Topomyia yanbarensis TaxID=2498891 RepID=UPI00273BC8E4|nr:chymotrypsin-elastase inhibitor ixodidin-like [Topomyia yanbarensis]